MKHKIELPEIFEDLKTSANDLIDRHRFRKFVMVKGRKVDKALYDLLHKYFEVDDENAILTVYMKYEKFSDLFTDEFFERGYILNSSFEDKLSYILKMIPRPYKANIIIVIKDYQGHTKEECAKICSDSIVFRYYRSERTIHMETRRSLYLMIIGILFLLANIIFLGLYTQDRVGASYYSQAFHDITSEILDIAAWVFVWEAVTLYFMDRQNVIFRIDKLKEIISKVKFEEVKPRDLKEEKEVEKAEESEQKVDTKHE